jgi:hypothetical protein
VQGKAEVEIELGDGEQPPWRGVLQLRPALNSVALPWPAALAGGLHLRVKPAYRYVTEGGADQRNLVAVLARFELKQ